jgi:hypothetical protein
LSKEGLGSFNFTLYDGIVGRLDNPCKKYLNAEHKQTMFRLIQITSENFRKEQIFSCFLATLML